MADPHGAAKEIATILSQAQEIEPRAEDAMALMADAIAFGCADIDVDPQLLLDRIREEFDRMHVEKYMGRAN